MSKPTRLRQILKDEGITQEMLAEWSGLHVNTIGHWGRGETTPKAKNIAKIAKVLRRDAKEFYEGKK